MKKLFCAALLLMSACTNEKKTRETLDNHGFSKIQTGGYAWLQCGEQDFYQTKFKAVNASGKKISGTVCCGIFKGCTVRF